MKVWTYIVKGFGQFPLDMLRYDCAYPANVDAVAEIAYSISADVGDEVFEIKLESTNHAPTQARWASFRWIVEELAVTKR